MRTVTIKGCSYNLFDSVWDIIDSTSEDIDTLNNIGEDADTYVEDSNFCRKINDILDIIVPQIIIYIEDKEYLMNEINWDDFILTKFDRIALEIEYDGKKYAHLPFDQVGEIPYHILVNSAPAFALYCRRRCDKDSLNCYSYSFEEIFETRDEAEKACVNE
jgi:hypothetical protein